MKLFPIIRTELCIIELPKLNLRPIQINLKKLMRLFICWIVCLFATTLRAGDSDKFEVFYIR